MDTNGSPATDTRIGGRPAAGVSSGCARVADGRRCGHPRALHGKDGGECKAFACKLGPNGEPCEGFVEAKEFQAA